MAAIQSWVVHRYVHNYCNGICKHIYISALKRRNRYKTGIQFNRRLICAMIAISAQLSTTTSKHVTNTVNLGRDSIIG